MAIETIASLYFVGAGKPAAGIRFLATAASVQPLSYSQALDYAKGLGARLQTLAEAAAFRLEDLATNAYDPFGGGTDRCQLPQMTNSVGICFFEVRNPDWICGLSGMRKWRVAVIDKPDQALVDILCSGKRLQPIDGYQELIENYRHRVSDLPSMTGNLYLPAFLTKDVAKGYLAAREKIGFSYWTFTLEQARLNKIWKAAKESDTKLKRTDIVIIYPIILGRMGFSDIVMDPELKGFARGIMDIL